MPWAACRCGEKIAIPDDGTDRVVCPGCSAKIRIRPRPAPVAPSGDGYLRFHCPCGRRLKVDAGSPPDRGRCPSCGRAVPVPAADSSSGSRPSASAHDPERRTDEMAAVDVAALERWSRGHEARGAGVASPPASAPAAPTPPPRTLGKAEAGLRVCPTCGRPVHLGADACRACGTAVPRR